MSDRKVLFIVEGRRTEPRFLERMHWVLFGTKPDNIYCYGTVIHDLLSRMFKEDESSDLDVVSVLRELDASSGSRAVLEQEFSDVYLVFDMDPQDQRYDSAVLKQAMEYFSDSTDNGKLYINYPMLESYRHLKTHDDSEYMQRTVSVDSLSGYKDLVEREGHPDFKDLGKYDEETFLEVIRMNLTKANLILRHDGSMPDSEIFMSWTGANILDVQISLIDEENRLYVLNTSVFYPVDFSPSRFL